MQGLKLQKFADFEKQINKTHSRKFLKNKTIISKFRHTLKTLGLYAALRKFC